MAFVTYKGVELYQSPLGAGGQVLNQNFRALADAAAQAMPRVPDVWRFYLLGTPALSSDSSDPLKDFVFDFRTLLALHDEFGPRSAVFTPDGHFNGKQAYTTFVPPRMVDSASDSSSSSSRDTAAGTLWFVWWQNGAGSSNTSNTSADSSIADDATGGYVISKERGELGDGWYELLTPSDCQGYDERDGLTIVLPYPTLGLYVGNGTEADLEMHLSIYVYNNTNVLAAVDVNGEITLANQPDTDYTLRGNMFVQGLTAGVLGATAAECDSMTLRPRNGPPAQKPGADYTGQVYYAAGQGLHVYDGTTWQPLGGSTPTLDRAPHGASGVYLTAPGGNVYRIQVGDDGTLSTERVRR